MTPPDPTRLFEVLDATWPAAAIYDTGPWRLREGRGGGQRVSAATAEGPVTPDDIFCAEAGMRDLGQRALFMIRDSDAALDAELERRGYDIVDPVAVYLAPASDLTATLAVTDAMPSWPPLALQCELWDAAGIGPARRAVMDRAEGPKTTFLGRSGDTPCGTGFVAMHDGVAMIHALEVTPEVRRRGVGRRMMQAAANWAVSNEAAWLTLAVTRANEAANALYRSLGMDEAARYHYRRAPEAAS